MTDRKIIDALTDCELVSPGEVKDSINLEILGMNVFFDNPQLLEDFRLLCFKGINTWSNAPKDLKKLVDYIWNGKLIQDYNSLPERKPEHTMEGTQHAERFKE